MPINAKARRPRSVRIYAATATKGEMRPNKTKLTAGTAKQKPPRLRTSAPVTREVINSERERPQSFDRSRSRRDGHPPRFTRSNLGHDTVLLGNTRRTLSVRIEPPSGKRSPDCGSRAGASGSFSAIRRAKLIVRFAAIPDVRGCAGGVSRYDFPRIPRLPRLGPAAAADVSRTRCSMQFKSSLRNSASSLKVANPTPIDNSSPSFSGL
jgi:hypothetical protein